MVGYYGVEVFHVETSSGVADGRQDAVTVAGFRWNEPVDEVLF